MFEKSKAYEEIKHQHEGKPTRLESKQCQRCKFDVAELSMVDFIKNLNVTKPFVDPDGSHTFVKMVVHRGHLDDCVSWDTLWL